MNATHWQNRLLVIQAFCEGKKIQCSGNKGEDWLDFNEDPPFEDGRFWWRIKPEPRRIWIAQDGLGKYLTEKPNSENFLEFVEVMK